MIDIVIIQTCHTCLTGLTGVLPVNMLLGRGPEGVVKAGRPPIRGPGAVVCRCMLNGGGPPPTGEDRKGVGRSSIGEIGCLIAGSIPPLPSGTPDNALATNEVIPEWIT